MKVNSPLTTKQLETLMEASDSPKATLRLLQDVYFPEVKRRMNSRESLRRLSLYNGEVLPSNERNLTDVRTRMGILIEFELARISNQIADDLGITDFFWSYVVANRFPDLEVRHNDGSRLLRIEVKCLQARAEEKSANFSTLIKDIDPYTDFVVVCTWDWNRTPDPVVNWDQAPRLFDIYVFHAYSLALMRDLRWLHSPQNLSTNQLQGFGLRHAITTNGSIYSREQGNYGKLLRIWDLNLAQRPKSEHFIEDTISTYLAFKDSISKKGFEVIATEHLDLLASTPVQSMILNSGREVYFAGAYAYVYGTVKSGDLAELRTQKSLEYCVTMSSKYKCKVVKLDDSSVLAKNRKPKEVLLMFEQG